MSNDKLAQSLLKPINPTVIVVLGLYTIIWGIWIANPLWEVFTRAPLYSAMEHLAPEWYWGVQAIVAGLFILRGALKPAYKNLITGAAIAAGHWFTIGMLYFIGDWQNTGGITAITFAIYSALVYLNIKTNRSYFDQETNYFAFKKDEC